MISSKNILLFLFLIVLICNSCVQSNTEKTAEIDKLLNEFESNRYRNDDLKTLELGRNAYLLSTKISDKKRSAKSCEIVALAALRMGLYDEAMKYADLGESLCSSDDYNLKIKFWTIKAGCVADLGLLDKSLEYNLKAIKLINSLESKDIKLKEDLFINYYHLSLIHSAKGDKDSFKKYEKKAEMLIPDLLNNAKNPAVIPTYYHNKGQQLMARNELDSAFVLINKGYEIKKMNNDSLLYMEYTGFGSYYHRKKDYKKALDYYQKAILNLETNKIWEIGIVGIYNDMAEMYRMLGNPEKEKEYLKLYLKKKDELTLKQNKDRNYAINVILKEQKEEQKSSHTKTIIIVSALSLLTILALFVFYKKMYNKKEEAMFNLQQEKDITVEELNKKVNESFDEVILLAKNNDSQFLPRFQEVYPHFSKKLLNINPNLKATELTLCAYIYLGFSTKEIADYTFKAEKTVRNNRYNLRKRLNIITEEDIVVWMRKCIDSK